MRCLKANRLCEGYDDQGALVAPPKKSRGLARLAPRPGAGSAPQDADVRILISPDPEAALFTDQRQWDAFQLFVLNHEQGDTILRDGLGVMMLQCSYSETSLREVCSGIGALLRALGHHIFDEEPMNADFSQALVHYSRAAKAVVSAGTAADNLPSVILTSFLFITFDMIAGNIASALKHHNHAVAMMEQHIDVRVERERVPLERLRFSRLETSMYEWLLRHDTHPWAIGFDGCDGPDYLRIIAPARRFPHCRHRHTMRDIPEAFDTIAQAMSWWYVAQHSMLHCLHEIKIKTKTKAKAMEDEDEEDESGAASSLWGECVAILQSWRASFAPLLQAARRNCDRSYRRWFKAMTLETLYVETLSAVHERWPGNRSTDVPVPPAAVAASPLHLEMIRHAVRLAEARGPFDGVKTLVEENDLVRPLACVQFKTRDPVVVRELTGALRRLGGGSGIAESLLYMREFRGQGRPLKGLERGWGLAMTSAGMTMGAELLDYLD
ncbi:uncharacterized protein GLRG_02621 [Colletotrichum graminicola M1.001]|uniref:C6 zinc finger domain-containing protein n=1 Tax=Colletotrichum graminicola (strain M1.001 / M2 / FGSC 10212) TaxID=645133 RepID=E3Q7G3_COLGM|nr:uncharacterized protein GLRG_02621 [Colletotrichum graminicola M1.001]EFQ26801.1 hypothetical protein GLRG_02621 [Colletotrichum graminicola M1.001]